MLHLTGALRGLARRQCELAHRVLAPPHGLLPISASIPHRSWPAHQPEQVRRQHVGRAARRVVYSRSTRIARYTVGLLASLGV